MLAIKKIGNTEPAVQPLRDGYQVLRSDLVSDGSGRSAETGTVIRYPIRSNTYKLNLKFKGPAADIRQVEGLVSQFSFNVEFFEGEYNQSGEPVYVTGHSFYPSDRTANYTGEMGELSVNLIEI
jgi:hypothetical protein